MDAPAPKQSVLKMLYKSLSAPAVLWIMFRAHRPADGNCLCVVG